MLALALETGFATFGLLRSKRQTPWLTPALLAADASGDAAGYFFTADEPPGAARRCYVWELCLVRRKVKEWIDQRKPEHN